MPMELQGFDNLKDDLTNMASNLEFGAGVNRALQEGAKPIEEQMLHNAASDPQIITGALHGSIHHHRREAFRKGRVLCQSSRERPRRPCARSGASLRAPGL